MVTILEEEQHTQITYDCLSYYKPVKLLEEIKKLWNGLPTELILLSLILCLRSIIKNEADLSINQARLLSYPALLCIYFRSGVVP